MTTKRVEEQDLEKYLEEELFDDDASKVEEEDLEEESVDAFVTASDWTTETIMSQMTKGNINLNPSFQRREAWTDDRKSAFIESLFMGLPVPQIVLAEKMNQRGTFIVLDGKQRLLAIRRFASHGEDGFKPLRLQRLEVRKDLEGKSLADIEQDAELASYLSSYENQPMRTVVVRNWRSDSVLHRIFTRLNSGSLPLSSQELRQALIPGKFVDFVNTYSADSKSIQKALRIDKPDFRMRDVEILVRFFAFRRFIGKYQGRLKDFLDKACDTLNHEWETEGEKEIQRMASACDAAIETTYSIFGRDSFRFWEEGRYKRPFNRAVFDIMTFYFADEELRADAVQNSNKIVADFHRLCTKDRTFQESLTVTTKSIRATNYRLTKWGRTLRRIGMNAEVPQVGHEAG